MKKDRKKILTLISAVLFVVVGGSYWYLMDSNKVAEGVTLSVMDVGQGDSIFISSPSGTQVLIDGGPDDTVISSLTRYMPINDRDIDMVVLTHPHADHLGGLLEVFERYKINTVVFSNISYDSEIYSEFLRKVEEEGSKVINPIAGDTFDIGGEAFLQVFWPLEDPARSSGTVKEATSYENVNNASIVMLLVYKEFKAFFTGDAEYHVQEQIKGGVGEIAVFKVPHQGARDGFHRGFWQELSPELAIISVGENSYGHPHREVLDYIGSNISQMKRTDIDSDVVVVSDGLYWEIY